MALADKLKKAASDAAYLAGYGAGRAQKAVREAAASPTAQKALASARDVAGRAADEVSSLAKTAEPTLRSAAEKTGAAATQAARKVGTAAGGLARDIAATSADAARAAASAATDAARTAGSRAGATVSSVATSARRAATGAAVKNAAGMREADARPHEVVDPKTGQKVVVEAYVKGPGGRRDYDAVYPRGAMGDFGPLGNKAVGTMLILAGVPMLVLPGPGAAAIAAGLYFLRKGGDATPNADGAAAGTATMDDQNPAGAQDGARRPADPSEKGSATHG